MGTGADVSTDKWNAHKSPNATVSALPSFPLFLSDLGVLGGLFHFIFYHREHRGHREMEEELLAFISYAFSPK